MSHANRTELRGRIFSIAAFAVTLLLWNWMARPTHSLWFPRVIALAVPALVFPVTWIGRSSLNRLPTPSHADAVTRIVHFLMMCVMGSAVVSAVVAATHFPWASIPFPRRAAEVLTVITGIAVLLTVLNLAARGLGAPFAIALSKRLATDWLYSRTRNPMVLCLFLFFFCLSLRLHSGALLAWEAFVFIPAMTVFVRFYEERELEIRFGPSYEQYRSATPMFWPRLHHR
jgi:protein-S-isoprenylcysteine O-methyltransferase Ste14